MVLDRRRDSRGSTGKSSRPSRQAAERSTHQAPRNSPCQRVPETARDGNRGLAAAGRWEEAAGSGGPSGRRNRQAFTEWPGCCPDIHKNSRYGLAVIRGSRTCSEGSRKCRNACTGSCQFTRGSTTLWSSGCCRAGKSVGCGADPALDIRAPGRPPCQAGARRVRAGPDAYIAPLSL